MIDGRVRFSEIDHTRKITVPSIINYFQDCSTFQSEDIGVGLDELSKKKKFQLHFWIKCAMMLTWKRWNRFQTTIRLCRNENRRKY